MKARVMIELDGAPDEIREALRGFEAMELERPVDLRMVRIAPIEAATPGSVIAGVCRHLGVSAAAMVSRARAPRVLSYARHLSMYLLHQDAGLSMNEIGRLLMKDRTSVYEGVRRVESELATREQTRDDVTAIRAGFAERRSVVA